VLAAIAAYNVGKFFHIFAAIIAFGPTYAYPFMGAIAAKTDPRSIPTIHRIIAAIDRYLLNPGLIVLIIAGFYTVHEEHVKLSESWVSIGIVAVIAIGAMQGMFFTKWNREALALAENDLKSGDTLGPEYMALTKKIATLGQIAGLIIVFTVFVMVVKPFS
jgi:uncharacterized membrane protein